MVSLPFLFFSHLGSFHLIGSLKVWQVSSGSLLHSLVAHESQIRGLCTTMDGNLIATSSQDKTIKMWCAKTLNDLATLLGHTDMVYAVTSNGERVISGGKDMIVRLWCLVTGELLFCFRGHSQSIRFVLATPDGSKALSSSEDTTFRVWDLDVSNFKQSEFSGHTKDVTDISVDVWLAWICHVMEVTLLH